MASDSRHTRLSLALLASIALAAALAGLALGSTAAAHPHSHPGKCPPEEPRQRWLHDHGPDLKRELLPRRATSVRICRYYEGEGETHGRPHAHVGGLAGEAFLPRPAKFIRGLDASPVTKERFNLCPFFENGPDYWIYARYRHRAPVGAYSFCGYAANNRGPLRRLGGFEANLAHLTGATEF
jgi:hypothetical protein